MKVDFHALRQAAALLLVFSLGVLSIIASGGGDSPGDAPPPSETADDYTAVAGETLEVNAENGVLANDFEGDARRFISELVTEPEHARDFVLNLDGSFRYTHDRSESTSDRFEYVATDDTGASSAPIPVTLRIVHRPRAVADTAETEAGEAARIEVLANDTDFDDELVPETVSIEDPPQHGTAQTNEDGSITYTPDAGSAGEEDSFSYRVSDQSGLDSEPGTVTVTVQYPPPRAEPDAYTVVGGETLRVPSPGPLANDTAPPGVTLEWHLVDEPRDAYREAFGMGFRGAFDYTSTPTSIERVDRFTYYAFYRDPDGVEHRSETTEVTITVLPEKPGFPAPQTEPDAYTVVGGETLQVPAPGPLGNDTAPPGVTLYLGMVEVTGKASTEWEGELNIAESGAFTYVSVPVSVERVERFLYYAAYRDPDGLEHQSESNVISFTILPDGE